MKVPASPPDRFSHDSYSPKPRMSPTESPNDGWRVSPGEAKVWAVTTMQRYLLLTLGSPPPVHPSCWDFAPVTAASISTLGRGFPFCGTAIAPKTCPAALGVWVDVPCNTGRFLSHHQQISMCQAPPVASIRTFTRTTVAKCTFKDRSPTMLAPLTIICLRHLRTLTVYPAPIQNCIATFNL